MGHSYQVAGFIPDPHIHYRIGGDRSKEKSLFLRSSSVRSLLSWFYVGYGGMLMGPLSSSRRTTSRSLTAFRRALFNNNKFSHSQ
jgi:hypothetical protein